MVSQGATSSMVARVWHGRQHPKCTLADARITNFFRSIGICYILRNLTYFLRIGGDVDGKDGCAKYPGRVFELRPARKGECGGSPAARRNGLRPDKKFR